MKKQFVKIVLGLTVLLGSSPVFSYINYDLVGMQQNNNNNQSVVSEKGANCAPATAIKRVDFNDVHFRIENGGNMWTDRANTFAYYEVPKGSGTNVIYAGSLWMGGTDVNGQLKIAALTFRSNEDFWPGPLSVNLGSGNYDPSQPVGDNAVRDFGAATIDPDQCEAYDKFYTIRKAEVIAYITWWECDQGISDPNSCVDVEKPNSEIMNRINNWPAHGDASRYQDHYLAPFYDNPGVNGGNADGQYNPDDGDYPWYDDILNRDDVTCGIDRRVTLFGDETHWWVFNDAGNIHGETNGQPIGMEIRAQAFVFATNDEVNRMTFYNYELINRGTQTLYNTYFSQYIDADVGNAQDDYTGCDVSRGLGYMFNGDNFDENGQGGALGYGDNPPAVGCDFFEGPYQDADGRDNVGPYFDSVNNVMVVPTVAQAINDTGIVYGGIGIGYSDGIVDNERFGMRRFTYYTNGAAFPYNDPGNAQEFYNYMQGLWQNGDEMYYGGTGGLNHTGVPSDYLFPGDSDPLNWGTGGVDLGFDWSETNTDGANGTNPPGDRRFVQSAGPFTLKPGAINNITVGIVYGRSSSGGLLASVDAMKRADTKAQALFDACFRILEPPYAPKLTIQELENELVLMLSNPPSSNNYLESYHEEDKVNITDPLLDRYYTFEGYQIYQLVDDEASIADLEDDTKAQIVAQCDIKNDIGDLINFEFNEDLGFSIGSRKVSAANKGIQHTFLITEDKFAQGVTKLVNHKRYYYIAVAYAHNEYAPYDPNDPLKLDGQKMPYISSRLGYDGAAVQSIEAIPHNPKPESGGLTTGLPYGSGPKIQRLDGNGNGGRVIDLTQESIDKIVSTGYLIDPIYQEGKGPINVKVVDPLNVVGGQFECKFVDYNASNIDNGADTAKWVINRYVNGALVESVSSEQSIKVSNEQVIPQWGISVQIYQNKYHAPEDGLNSPQALTTDFLEATISYADSSKQWLTGVPDSDNFFPTNWIRSGTFDPDEDDATSGVQCTDNPNVPNYLESCDYPDEIGIDNTKKWTKVLEGTVAPHRLVGYQGAYMPLAYFNYNPSSARQYSSIRYLPSVDIIFTNDKSKWTRCPVIELGRESSFNIGNAQPGEMRKSPSVDKNGNPDGTGTGMGWFPGYAIDVESGARLYMAFGENSFLANDNGTDMIWNPSDRMVDNAGNPIMGGMHPIYIFNYQKKSINKHAQGYDYPAYVPSEAENLATHKLYQDYLLIEANNPSQKTKTYGNMSWVLYPLTVPGKSVMETDVTVRLRVSKEYKNFYTENNITGGPNAGAPMYSWNMDDVRTRYASNERLSEVLDMINVVPNPYYAYSDYERNRLDTRVKITNLPERCTIKIFTTNGKLVRQFEKDSPETYLDWDLNNSKRVPVAGGLYLIHVEIPGVGETVLKFFGGMRQIDLQGI